MTFACLLRRNVCVCLGLVPEPTFQREAHEAAERAGCAEARVFPQPEADEDAGGPVGARGAHPQRALLLLRRYATISFFANFFVFCTCPKLDYS